jgi:hypothetical protein
MRTIATLLLSLSLVACVDSEPATGPDATPPAPDATPDAPPPDGRPEPLLWGDAAHEAGNAYREHWAIRCNRSWYDELPQDTITFVCDSAVTDRDCDAPAPATWNPAACAAALDAMPCGDFRYPSACAVVMPSGVVVGP